MLVQEKYGENLIKTYSDAGKYILQNETGCKYSEAIDVEGKYTYTETDEDIPERKELKKIPKQTLKPRK